MKVSSAPFEAPVGLTKQGSAPEGVARALSEKASPHLVSSPTGGSSVKSGLDAATKDALLRLANLAKEKEKEKEEEEKRKSAKGPAKRLVETAAGSSSSTPSKIISANDKIAVEAVREYEPASISARMSLDSNGSAGRALERIRSRFEAARKKVGGQIYREAVRRQSIVELEKQFNLDLDVDDLESLRDVELMEDSGKLESLNFSGVGLKRVA